MNEFPCYSKGPDALNTITTFLMGIEVMLWCSFSTLFFHFNGLKIMFYGRFYTTAMLLFGKQQRKINSNLSLFNIGMNELHLECCSYFFFFYFFSTHFLGWNTVAWFRTGTYYVHNFLLRFFFFFFFLLLLL